jgi:hypothetical protein
MALQPTTRAVARKVFDNLFSNSNFILPYFSAKQSAQDSAAIGLQSIAGAAGPGGIQLSTLPPQHLQVYYKI